MHDMFGNIIRWSVCPRKATQDSDGSFDPWSYCFV